MNFVFNFGTNPHVSNKAKIWIYKVGPILPLPLDEKKLDFSPVWVTRKVPRRKSTGTATKRRVAAAPKLVVSIETNGYSQKLSLSGPIKLINDRALHRDLQGKTNPNSKFQ